MTEAPMAPLHDDPNLQRLVVQLAFLSAFVETGCHLGGTFRWVIEHLKVPAYTCDNNWAYVAHTDRAVRMKDRGQVRVVHNQSPDFLLDLLPLTGCPLFWLDAHGGPDWPLRQEIARITAFQPRWSIIIDDCFVPERPHISHDVWYGQRCDIAYVKDLFIRCFPTTIRLYYPDYDAPTGYALLTNSGVAAAIADSMTFLTQPDGAHL